MTEPLWGGRFGAGPDSEMLRLTGSIDVDIRLLPFDLDATKAHARVLAQAGLLVETDLEPIDEACDQILHDWATDALMPHPLDEDVHTLVERELTERLDQLGARIHAGRSRNDLVAQDLRLWAKTATTELLSRVDEVIGVVLDRAEENVGSVMPGYTHLQRAQPVDVGFWLSAHATALTRDRVRLLAARDAADVAVLGAGALAGSTLDLDPSVAAAELGLGHLFVNAMDAVSDRDFLCDLAYACALCGVHLSRLAEDLVIYASSEFGFVQLADEWSTGSSMMPQKRNPDVAELVRGRAAGGIADLIALLTLLKGLPLSYDRDLQEDKSHAFATVDRLHGCLRAMSGLLSSISFDRPRMREAATEGAMWATDVAESLVRSGTPFRQAHAEAGGLVARSEAGTVEGFSDVPEISGGPEASVAKRSAPGGTSAERVKEQIVALRALVASD
jgi:argininosuccinate lyase